MTNELQHHGILGMKWGVRRYQNKDGSLTDKGERRYAKVAGSEELQKKHTKKAVSHLKMSIKAQQHAAKDWDKKYKENSKDMKRSMKKLEKASKNGNEKKIKKYNDQFLRSATLTSASVRLKNQNAMAAAMNQKRLCDIESGTLKAGRDFIMTKVYRDDVQYKGIYNELIVKKKG